MGKKLTVIRCEPNKEATIYGVVNLDFWIAPANRKEYDLGDAVLIFDGKAGEKGYPMNRFIEFKDTIDVINGPFLICSKDEEGKYISPTTEVVNKYMKEFLHPQIFLFVNDKLHIIKVRYGTEYMLFRTIDIGNHDDEKVPDDAVVLEEESNG